MWSAKGDSKKWSQRLNDLWQHTADWWLPADSTRAADQSISQSNNTEPLRERSPAEIERSELSWWSPSLKVDTSASRLSTFPSVCTTYAKGKIFFSMLEHLFNTCYTGWWDWTLLQLFLWKKRYSYHSNLFFSSRSMNYYSGKWMKMATKKNVGKKIMYLPICLDGFSFCVILLTDKPSNQQQQIVGFL